MKRNHTASYTQHLEPIEHLSATYKKDLVVPLDDSIIQEDQDNPDLENKSPSSGWNKESGKGAKKELKALKAFGNDITQQAQEGKIDPIIGRENEIERLIQILCRLKKNNPVLIGEPGVGKTAIIEGLAQRIVSRSTPRLLQDKRIYSLDTALLVAGTQYRGEFEDRMKRVVQELKEHPEIILFIDEIHTIVGAGNASKGLDMANILKPALSRGEIRCIGATTLSEYTQSIEKDGALERRFQKIIVQPTTQQETLDILRAIKSVYEGYHKVHYTDEALQEAVALTHRYMSDRFFPDKAIDAIDEAGAKLHALNSNPSEEITELENMRKEFKQKRLDAVQASNYELAASWREKEREITHRIEELDNETHHNNPLAEVTAEHIAQAVSLITGIPLERVAQTETARLRTLQNTLNKIVIGQEEAIEKVAHAIQRNRLGLRNEKRPIGSFLFLGPTGVGKTFLAKKLAEQIFGDEEAIIRMDMSEFSEKFTTSRLVGAPPGYVGYEEGGQLTEKVRRKPYSVVLLDEIEKAHPEVFNLLLQMLDEGALTDSLGRKVDFKNTVVIMTGNVGSRLVREYNKPLGFSDNLIEKSQSQAQRIVEKELKRTFSPEFLNRLDAVIHFASLDEAALLRIVVNEINIIKDRLTKQNYTLDVDEKATQWLAQKGYDPDLGVRPLKRLLQNEIEDRLTDLILEDAIHPEDSISFVLDAQKEHLKARYVSRINIETAPAPVVEASK